MHRKVRQSNLRLYANKVWLGRMKGKEDRWGLKGKVSQGGETEGEGRQRGGKGTGRGKQGRWQVKGETMKTDWKDKTTDTEGVKGDRARCSGARGGWGAWEA